MAKTRSQDDVRREIEQEREQLVTAVEQLRGDIRSAANVKPLLVKAGAAVLALGTVRAVVRRVSAARRRKR